MKQRIVDQNTLFFNRFFNNALVIKTKTHSYNVNVIRDSIKDKKICEINAALLVVFFLWFIDKNSLGHMSNAIMMNRIKHRIKNEYACLLHKCNQLQHLYTILHYQLSSQQQHTPHYHPLWSTIASHLHALYKTVRTVHHQDALTFHNNSPSPALPPDPNFIKASSRLLKSRRDSDGGGSPILRLAFYTRWKQRYLSSLLSTTTTSSM